MASLNHIPNNKKELVAYIKTKIKTQINRSFKKPSSLIGSRIVVCGWHRKWIIRGVAMGWEFWWWLWVAKKLGVESEFEDDWGVSVDLWFGKETKWFLGLWYGSGHSKPCNCLGVIFIFYLKKNNVPHYLKFSTS